VGIDLLLFNGEQMLFFLLSYSILGAGIKFIDAAYDEKTFSKKTALIVAPFLGLLWAYSMIINPVSATILLAIVCGVVLKGKIDNYAHLIGLLVIVGIVLLARIELLIIPLIFLSLSALLDEVGNDLVDKNKEHLNEDFFVHKLVISFFDQRWFMKVAILCIALIGIIPIYFFFAMLFFDGAYLIMRWYGEQPKGTITYKLKSVKAAIIPERNTIKN
jgi:hypothetical protein